MSAILFITAIQVFLMGLVSEQISALNYKESNADAGALNVRAESSLHEQLSPTQADSNEQALVSLQDRHN